MAYVMDGKKPGFKSTSEDPERRLNEAMKTASLPASATQTQDLPGTALSYVDLGYGKRHVYTYSNAAEGRTAGPAVERHTEVAPPENKTTREPITRVKLSAASWSHLND